MWMLGDDERVLTTAEWTCIRLGLATLYDFIDAGDEGSADLALTGVAVFDQLSAPQKLAILADTCEALTVTSIPAPELTAVNEGTIAALLQTFWNQLVLELDLVDDFDDFPMLECRRALLSVLEETDDPDTLEMLPKEDDLDAEVWHDMFTLLESRFLDDTDYEMAALLDLPSEKAEGIKAILGIDDEYFISIPPDPTERQLHKVRQKLAKLLDLPCPDDDGRFPTIFDRYTGLFVGPCTEQEIAAWSENPWVDATALETPTWDCEYKVWKANFTDALMAADPKNASESAHLQAERGVRRDAALQSLGAWPGF